MRALSEEVLITPEALAKRVDEIARAIEGDTPEGGEISALIVLKGAFVFGADLLRRVRRPVRVGFLEIHKDPQDPDEVDFIFTHPFAVEGSDLLVVEDILDTGITMNALLARLRQRRPRRLRTAILLDKKERREVPCPVEYTGFEVPDKWVVGYGLDDAGLYRNLPGIQYVQET